MDSAWWKVYHKEAKATFKGELLALHPSRYGIKNVTVTHYQNSGAGAISLAIAKGATKVILLGYDLQHTGGKAHWHGDHPGNLGNAGKVSDWPAQFELLAKHNSDITIINCSRTTALTCFPKQSLEQALNEPD